MGTKTALTSGQKAHQTVIKAIRKNSKKIAKSQDVDLDKAYAIAHKDFYAKRTAKMAATREKNKAKHTTPKATPTPKVQKPLLPDFASNMGKQMSYTTLLGMAKTLKGKLVSLTMPGINTEFETRLEQQNDDHFQQYMERDPKIHAILCKNFELASGSPLSFPEDIPDPRLNRSFNFIWLDFMGKYLTKYSDGIKHILSDNEKTEMVFATTIGSRGPLKNTIALDNVNDELLSIFKSTAWVKKAAMTCTYQSDKGTTMTVFMYTLGRTPQWQNKMRKVEAKRNEAKRLEAIKQIKALESKLIEARNELNELTEPNELELRKNALKDLSNSTKRTKRAYNITPEAATARAVMAAETRRRNKANS